MLKTDIYKHIRSVILIFAGLFFLVLSIFSGIGGAQSIDRGYKSDEPIQQGLMVKEKKGDNTKVEAVDQASLGELKGVVVAKNDSPVILSSSDQTIFVANSGTHDVLVSDENGKIKTGDYLSISSLKGIAMKATGEQSLVLGQAATDFTGSGDSIGSTSRKSDNKKINIGRIPVNISIVANPLQKNSRLQTVPSILRDVSSNVAGKPVDNGRIWLASIVFLATSLLTGLMLYGGAKSSLLAMGRNPLSKSSILRGLLQVVVLGLIVFICGMFGVYLLLKL
jgi:hypothetical protein